MTRLDVFTYRMARFVWADPFDLPKQWQRRLAIVLFPITAILWFLWVLFWSGIATAGIIILSASDVWKRP